MGAAARPISTAAGNNVYRTLYQNVFKSNIAYLTYVFAGAIALEWVYSKGIDTAWEISNSGVRPFVGGDFVGDGLRGLGNAWRAAVCGRATHSC